MAVRVTQSYISVLRKVQGELRITQTFISVLLQRNVFNKKLTQVITLDDEFDYDLVSPTFEEGFEDTLEFEDEFYLPELEKEIVHTLDFEDEFMIDPRSFTITDTLDLEDEFSFIDSNIPQDYEDILVLEDEFLLTEVVEPFRHEFGDVLRFYNPLTDSYEGMDDVFSRTISNLTVVMTDVLSFAETFSTAYEFLIEDELEFVDAFVLPNSDTLDFDEDWDVINTSQIADELSFEDEFTFTQDAGKTITDELELTQNFRVVADASVCEYQLPDPPVLGHATLTLQYGMTTLVLRNPEFNDVDQRAYTRIQRETRGGKLIIYADDEWTKTKRLNYSIRALPDADEVLAFLQLSVGQLITLTDHYDREWEGIILNPNTAVTQNGFCRAEFNLEFEGELV